MSCNLIAVTPDRFSEKLVDRAIADSAAEKKKLIVLLINDPVTIDKTVSEFKHSSPVGSSKKIIESLESYHKFLLTEDLSDIEKKAEAAQIGYEEIKKTGDFESEVLKTVRKQNPDTLFVCRMETKTPISRFFGGSAVKNLEKNCPCKVVIV